MSGETNVTQLGNISDHGGVVISCGNTVQADKVNVSRLGDMHACPIPHHGVTAILGGVCQAVISEGNNLSHLGSTTGCGATIISGATDVEAG